MTRLQEAAKAIVSGQWEHRCSDKVGGCTAVSASAIDALERALASESDAAAQARPDYEAAYQTATHFRGRVPFETAGDYERERSRSIVDAALRYPAPATCETCGGTGAWPDDDHPCPRCAGGLRAPSSTPAPRDEGSERERFEKWNRETYSKTEPIYARYPADINDGAYYDSGVQQRWIGWEARAAREGAR